MSSKQFSVRSTLGDYSVIIQEGAFKEALVNLDIHTPIVADAFLRNHPGMEGRNVKFIDALEENKNLTTVEELIDFLRESGSTRDSNLIAVGGGVIQDIVTLVAALYMRGITWSYYPTTTLGMIDSCIGGKSSINTTKAKNLIGSIYPPREIIIDTDFAKSLSTVDHLCGIVEGVKITFCGGPDDFSKMSALLDRPNTNLEKIILTALTTKKRFVEEDEFDLGVRQLLNFGHTFGHALEVGSRFQIPHGIAVAYGMISAASFCDASQTPVRFDTSELIDRCRSVIDEVRTLLPPPNLDLNATLAAFRTDKKHSTSHFRLILPLEGGVQKIELDRTTKNEKLLIDQLQRALEN